MWQPIKKTEMKERLTLDVEQLSAQARQAFLRTSVPIAKIACLRNEVSGIEWLFVVAKIGERVLVYDDVEDEYAVGVLPKEGPLLNWTLYGPLNVALSNLLDTHT